jgi:release factor family 10
VTADAPAGDGQPDRAVLRELAEWTPPLGVISICLDADPGDRSEGWRIALRERLRGLAVPDADPDAHAHRAALAGAVGRALARFAPDRPPPGGRTQLGYVEVGERGRERWYAVQTPLPRFDVAWRPRPYLRPLVELLAAARPLAVVLLSSERIRLLDFRGGRIAEVEEFELETYEPVWRERKAPGAADPARGQGASSSGHDQFDQRLEANRDRFIKDVGARIAGRAGAGELLAFGEAALYKAFGAGLGAKASATHLDEADLISEPAGMIAERVVEVLPSLDAARQAELVERALDEAAAGGRASVGVEETAQALAEGRVDRLLIDAERDLGPRPELADPLGISAEAADDIAEWMIETAIRTSAEATLLRGEPAEALAKQDGTAALLRY